MRLRLMWPCALCFLTPAASGFKVGVSPASTLCCSLQRRNAIVRVNGKILSSRDPISFFVSKTLRPSMNAVNERWDGLAELKGAAVGFVAAAFVLAGNAGPALAADSMLWPAVAAAASAADVESATGSPAIVSEPTAKLTGELASVFRKAQDAGSLQQFDKALKLYNQVVKYAPGYVYGWSNRANVYIAKGDLKGAIADYDKALELSEGLSVPDKWVILLNRGTTLLATGEDDRALADFNQAAFLNKQKDLYTLANRAQAWERRGEWAKALADYEGAVSVQPGNVQPWWIRYGLVLFQEGKEFDSVSFLKRLQAKFEGVAEVQAALTAVQFGRGETREAEREWAAVNKVDQDIFLKGTYTQDKLKWPPRAIDSLRNFDRLVVRGDYSKR